MIQPGEFHANSRVGGAPAASQLTLTDGQTRQTDIKTDGQRERANLDLPRVVFVFFFVLKVKGHSHPLLSLLLPQSRIKAVTVRLVICTHTHTHTHARKQT